jgi:hypothetical protein
MYIVKFVTVDMLRAHLLMAALTALIVQVASLTSLLFGVEESVFDSSAFRASSVLAIIVGTLMARRVAHFAFSGAVKSHHATCCNQPMKRISVASDCPRRSLVILHLRLSGIPFELA